METTQHPELVIDQLMNKAFQLEPPPMPQFKSLLPKKSASYPVELADDEMDFLAAAKGQAPLPPKRKD